MALVSPESGRLSIALTATLNTTPEIDFAGARGGTILIPDGSSITSLTYYAAEKIGGTYLPLNKSDGSAAVAQTVAAGVAGNAYDMPGACFGVLAMKIVANAPGSVFMTLKG